jgi:hypothetical protein
VPGTSENGSSEAPDLQRGGGRVCAADKSFVAFEARGGRGRGSFLRVIRRRPSWSPLDRPLSPASGRLTLAA